MPIFFVLIICGWFIWGDPPKTVANWFWADDAAPWETVDAFYYPDRSNLALYRSHKGLDSVQECRNWVRSAAASHGDANLIRGDYECGVEVVDTFVGISVYRTTVR